MNSRRFTAQCLPVWTMLHALPVLDEKNSTPRHGGDRCRISILQTERTKKTKRVNFCLLQSRIRTRSFPLGERWGGAIGKQGSDNGAPLKIGPSTRAKSIFR